MKEFIAALLAMSKSTLVDLLKEKSLLIQKVTTELGDSSDGNLIKSLTGTPEEKAKGFTTLNDEADAIEAELKNRGAIDEAKKRNSDRLATLGTTTPKNGNDTVTKDIPEDQVFQKAFKIPAKAKMTKSKNIKDDRMAYAIGQWASSIWGEKQNQSYAKEAKVWCNDHLNMKALDENFNETGGALVPYEFWPVIVDLREEYGVVRRNMDIIPMKRDVMPFPRRNAHVSWTWVTNNQKPTESAPTFNNIELVAKKGFGWISLPYELLTDSPIALGDWVAKDFAWAASKGEDDAMFLGDGTETYGQVMGLKNSLLNLSATVANIAGIQVASTKTWGSMVKTDISALQGRLPGYALPNAKFYCSSAFHFNVFQRLLYAQGGSSGVELRSGIDSKQERVFLYNGFEVEICQNLPSIPDQINDAVCYFGDINLAAKFADRQEFSVSTSDQVLFLNDQIAIKATERVAMSVHDVGNASGTASARVAGPMTMLYTPAS